MTGWTKAVERWGNASDEDFRAGFRAGWLDRGLGIHLSTVASSVRGTYGQGYVIGHYDRGRAEVRPCSA